MLCLAEVIYNVPMTFFGFVVLAIAVMFLIRSLFRKAVSSFGVALLIAGLLIDVVTALVN